MSDYSTGKIYKLIGECGNIYIGSTIRPLARRLSCHKTQKNQCVSKTLINPKIELIEEYPCLEKSELLEREQYWIEQHECINKFSAKRNKKEWMRQWRERNKEKRSKDYKEWEAKNNPRVVCECGTEVTKLKLNRHRQSLKHQRLLNEKKNEM